MNLNKPIRKLGRHKCMMIGHYLKVIGAQFSNAHEPKWGLETVGGTIQDLKEMIKKIEEAAK